jgi:peptidase E
MLPADPRHRFLLLGSGEFERWASPADRFALERAYGDGSVVILPTASVPDGEDTFESWARKGVEHYASLGVPARLCPLARREDAFEETLTAMLDDPSMIFFSGGSPAYLAATIRGTPFERALRRALDRGAIFGGCSAGAMLAGARTTARLNAGLDDDDWRPALELYPQTVFGPHWDGIEDKSAAVLEHVVPAGGWLVTIDEKTALFTAGEHWHVFGESRVTARWNGTEIELVAGEHSVGDSFAPPVAVAATGPVVPARTPSSRPPRR